MEGLTRVGLELVNIRREEGPFSSNANGNGEVGINVASDSEVAVDRAASQRLVDERERVVVTEKRDGVTLVHVPSRLYEQYQIWRRHCTKKGDIPSSFLTSSSDTLWVFVPMTEK